MSCPKHEEASAYLDEMLAPAERQRFAAHLPACPLCRQQLDELAALRQALQELPSPPLGFDLAARLEERIRVRAPRRAQGRPFWAGWGASGIGIALSVASGAWLGTMLVSASAVAPPAPMVRVFDPVPPGGLCAAAELCRTSKGMQ
jgi:anti-sigma factor RsiW